MKLNGDDIQEMISASPFAAQFELEVTGLTVPGPELRMVMKNPDAGLLRNGESQQLHGGALASLVDLAGYYVVAAVLGRSAQTISISVDYLRPAMRGALKIIARPIKCGRTTSLASVDITDGSDRLLACGRVGLIAVRPIDSKGGC